MLLQVCACDGGSEHTKHSSRQHDLFGELGDALHGHCSGRRQAWVASGGRQGGKAATESWESGAASASCNLHAGSNTRSEGQPLLPACCSLHGPQPDRYRNARCPTPKLQLRISHSLLTSYIDIHAPQQLRHTRRNMPNTRSLFVAALALCCLALVHATSGKPAGLRSWPPAGSGGVPALARRSPARPPHCCGRWSSLFPFSALCVPLWPQIPRQSWRP